ncbi:MAG: hypothetical protein AAF942_02505 [Pseudomonadota bacterium]
MSSNVPGPNELLAIEAMRLFRYGATDSSGTPTVGPSPFALQRAMHSLISLIWETDPAAVKLHQAGDGDLSLFEMHFLYVISEHVHGDGDTVDELLDWWLPRRLIDASKECLENIRAVLEDLDFAFDSRPWIRATLIATMEKRTKSSRPAPAAAYAKPAETRSQSAVTLH